MFQLTAALFIRPIITVNVTITLPAGIDTDPTGAVKLSFLAVAYKPSSTTVISVTHSHRV